MPRDRLIRSIDELPIALTVAEAALALQANKNKIYDLIRLWHATGGAEGLRAVRLGRSPHPSHRDVGVPRHRADETVHHRGRSALPVSLQRERFSRSAGHTTGTTRSRSGTCCRLSVPHRP